MAKNEYHIVFENKTTPDVESPTATNKDSTTQEEKDAKALTSKIKGYASFSYAESVVDRVISIDLNTVELRTGHQELQQRMQYKYGVIKQGFDIARNAFAAGSIFGGAGIVLGAVVGIADSLINVGIKQSEINMRREIENTSIYFNRIRAGAGQDRTGKSR